MKQQNVFSLAVLFLLIVILFQGSFPFVFPDSLGHRKWKAKTTCSRSFECDTKYFCKSETSVRSEEESRTSLLTSDERDVDEHNDSFPDLTPICRIVTRSGKRIPTDPSILPPGIYQSPYLLDKLDAFYHAKARNIEQDLFPLQSDERTLIEGTNACAQSRISFEEENDEENTNQIARKVPPLRHSLEDSGFKLLSQRDIDLCESLNAGYLLRLSLLPDVRELDPIIFKEFYPERFHTNGTLKVENNDFDDILFDGRILVYWRGYSQEVTKGRLLLPKLDYLQANLVQRAAVWVKKQMNKFESSLFRTIQSKSRRIRGRIRNWKIGLSERLQIPQFKQWIQSIISDGYQMEDQLSMSEPIHLNEEIVDDYSSMSKKNINVNRRKTVLSRYEGFKTVSLGSPDPLDALSPFTLCEIDYNEEKFSLIGSEKPSTNFSLSEDVAYEDSSGNNPITCAYDGFMSSRNDKELPRMQLLERVSIGSLIDVFDKVGRRGLIKTIFEKSELVEPTYEEVVVVWRPLVKQKRKIGPPKVVSEFADMFDIEGFEQPEEDNSEQTGNLEVRLFEQVPMSNLQAVMPKSKLVFRPADAFLFDTISFTTFAIVLGSIRFDNTRLDLLALVSVTLWILRTVFRYSNKLARYDLLVKTFLTSKISQRNAGALQYLSYEAGSQRAIRAALVHRWVLQEFESERFSLTKSSIEIKCETRVNQLLNTENEVQIDVKRAIQDLEDLRLISFSKADDRVWMVKDVLSSTKAVEQLWMELLENDRRFGADSMDESEFKSDPVVREDDLDFLDVLEEIDNAAANVQKLSAGDWRERRKVFATKIEEKKARSIAKARAAIEEKKEEGIAKAKAALEEKKEESLAKAKALLEEKKDESIAKAKALLEEKKEKSIAKAKAALEEGKDVGISKAREFLPKNRNQQSNE
mmetsp:Transcript_5378/g.13512  ORF Transcript_5378/g.13512 Transcript_5378/m.13512 type:complete len:922 (-) Transcript_5378:194-2959(-)